MSKWKWGSCLLISFLLLILSSSSLLAAKTIYLYDQSVLGEIDLDAYLADGTVINPDGKGFSNWVQKGPAPDPYPTIGIPEKTFENLGMSNMEMDGIIFVNHGRNLVKNKKAIVLWKVRIPHANQRVPEEFHADLTLCMWVDWNRDNMWKPNEQMIAYHFNLYDQFPMTDDELVVYYLDSFVVPDIENLMDANRGPNDKDLRYLWARAVLACDDPDMSPDGEQIFGEYEDYRLAYMVTPRKLSQ